MAPQGIGFEGGDDRGLSPGVEVELTRNWRHEKSTRPDLFPDHHKSEVRGPAEGP